MKEKNENEKKHEEKKEKMKYVAPKTVKHDPVEIVCGTCDDPNECSLYYTY